MADLRARRSSAVLTLALAAVSGCSHDAAPDALFPLAAGHRWTYRVVTQWSDGRSEEGTLALTTLGEEPLPGGDAGTAWRRHSDDGIDHWLTVDASGIRRVATRSLRDEASRPDPPQRYVLKAPYVVGTQWEALTTAYVLERRYDFPREAMHTYKPVTMVYRIEEVNDSVDTPAGHYTACLRVRGVATMRVYADPVAGWRELPLTTLEWYCPGVGLVRLERSETAESSFVTGGTQTLALTSFK